MPRTQRAIRRRSRRVASTRTTSNDLYRLSGSLGYSNDSGGNSSYSSNGNGESIANTQPVRRASLSPPEPGRGVHKVEAVVSDESSDGWSDDENEMSGDVNFSMQRGNENDEDDGQSSSDSQYSASSSSSHSFSNSGDSRDSDSQSISDGNTGSSDQDGDGHPDYEYGETLEPKFEQSDFDSQPLPDDQPSGFGAEFDDGDMFDMGGANDYNSPAGYSSSGEGEEFFPETEMDAQGDFDSGFPDEDGGNDYVGSFSDEGGDHDDGFNSIPMVISSTSDDEHQQDNGLEEDDFDDPTRNYDSRYDGALSDVVEGDNSERSGSENENDFDHDAYDAGNAMYGSGSGSGLGYINADNSSRSQPDPLLKPFVGERPPTPPSPCESTSETSLKSYRSAKSSMSSKSARSLRSPKSVKLSGVGSEDQDDQFDCQTFLAPPSINLGSDPDFQTHGIGENDLSVPFAEEDVRSQDHSHLQQNMYDDQLDPYDGNDNEYGQEGDSQFLQAESDQYYGDDQPQDDDQYNYPSNATYQHQTEQHLSTEPSYRAESSIAHDDFGVTPSASGDSLSDLKNARRRDRKIIRLLAIGLCCALFSFAMVLGGAVTAAILRKSNPLAGVTTPSNLLPQGSPSSPTTGEEAPMLRPSLRPTSTQVTITDTRAPTTSPTRRPTPKPSASLTPAPKSEAPTPAPTLQPTPGTNNVAATGGFGGSGFGTTNSFGSVTVP